MKIGGCIWNCCKYPLKKLQLGFNDENTCKPYQPTGLFMALCRYRDVQEIIAGDPFTNNGVLMENVVANALYRKGCPLCYHSKRNSTLEVDFVMKYQGKVCIMEVKSAGRGTYSSR